jgi:hypothetical protein
MYNSKDPGYNPLLGDRTEAKPSDVDKGETDENADAFQDNMQPRESVAWFGSSKIPESMNFEELESVMWRKVSFSKIRISYY